MITTVFLDRDGTLTVAPPEGDYVLDPAALTLAPGAGDAVRRLNDAGIVVVLVTNQRCIARGMLTAHGYAAVHDRLVALLADHGARLDAAYHCPHEYGECDCRKPDVGMFLRAAAEVPGVDLLHAAMVGDTDRDVEAGNRLGLLTVLVGEREGRATPDVRVATMPDAVDELLTRRPAAI